MTDVCLGLPEVKLTTQEENALSKRGTPAAHNTLVMHNMREAIKYTKRVCNSQIPDDQLLSICYTAMLGAARRFKPDWARFFAFSKAHLRGAVKEYFTQTKVMKKGFTLSREELVYQNNRYADPSDDCHMDVETVTGEIVEPDFKTVKLHEQWALVKPLLDTLLSEREFMIVDLHFTAGLTLAQIGKRLGVTCEAIRHIRSRALRKVRTRLLGKHQLYSDF